MTKIHAQETVETAPSLGSGTSYVNFQFLKIDSSFHRLMPNEKVVAKQEFLSAFDTSARQMPVVTYALTGLRSDCDILIWRLSPSLEALQGMTCRLLTAGMGKHLLAVHSFLGTPLRASATLASAKYLFVHPHTGERPGAVEEVQKLASKHLSVKLHVAECVGLDDQDYVFAFEADNPKDYLKLASELKTLHNHKAFACVLREIRDIVDCFG